ncbi:hypothetical protein GCM10027079_31770 [Sediminivirga luteola]|uniref:Uncharacterized protein n=1 Tax=Sediminivirga luteola TaxID=1774748 RepID=A0A8J2XKN8_9MICO|nr:hypothetical protein GCM10011333_18890 [Sediminivirga luteola]
MVVGPPVLAAAAVGGAFATVALNVGAVVGPITDRLAIEAIGVRGPVFISAVLVILTVLLWRTVSMLSRRGGPAPVAR